ncbi:putative metallopeptidase [Methylobacterium symbioticum]|uniref:Putative phage metallopeptidase domain-containing protein n=1 Tax=Methylobacterium symbioticum TaxID=2584084 RepID=A0A509EE46_9HYPH|nr:putative metallopeptidase [Methylobacterium symbioticum]VUD71854.1 hypothetical protein MET9862_02443 [Methylobacterium symbioticum]
MLTRPRPPERLLGQDGADTAIPFEPAPDLEAWARATFIDEDAVLLNEEHAHLREATLGFLWTSVSNARGGNSVVGQAEIPSIQGGKWARARFFQQVEGWFGIVPDFLITLDAGFADQADDATFCSLVEHELYHCAQAKDRWGAPRFSKATGLPIFTMRGHDVEEFVGIVARYGVGAAAGQTAALVEAAGRAPIVCSADIAGVCGTCNRRG